MRAERGEKSRGKNRKRYDRGGKKSLHKSFRSGVRWPSSSYRSWNWVRPVFPGDLFPTKIATCASIVFFNPPPPLPLFFSFLYFKGEEFPFSDVNSIFRASNSKIKKVVKDFYEVGRNSFPLKIEKLRLTKRKSVEACLTSLLHAKNYFYNTLPLHPVSIKHIPPFYRFFGVDTLTKMRNLSKKKIKGENIGIKNWKKSQRL